MAKDATGRQDQPMEYAGERVRAAGGAARGCTTRDDLSLSILQLHTRWPIRPSGCRVGHGYWRRQIAGSSKDSMKAVARSTCNCLAVSTYRLGSDQKLAPLFDDRNRS